MVALAGGLIVPLAFAPLDWWPLAILGAALLLLVWQLSTPWQAARRGFLFGLALFGVGINWVFISIHFHGFVGLGLSLFLTGLLIGVMALFPAALGYATAKLFPLRHDAGYGRLKLLLAMPALWVLAEWVRGWFMTGFPWLSLGYSQLDSPLAGIAPVLGVFGVSWAVVLTAALIVASVLDRRGIVGYALGAALLWLGSWGMYQVHWSTPAGAPLRVTLLQGNIPQDLKWHPAMRKPTIDLYTALTRANWQSDLIIWPESALPAFYYEAEVFLDDLEQEAKQNGTDLLIGILHHDRDAGLYFNSMLSLGSHRAFYHKHHLVPFTEYLPFKDVLGSLVNFMQVPMSDFSSGSGDQRPLSVAGQRAGISICFEDAFGEEVIRALPEATLLVNVSNDAWFDDSWAPHQHLQLARMRALESARPMLRATNTGVTAVVDHKGQTQSVARQFKATALTDTVQPMAGQPPYSRVGNWAVVLMALGCIVAMKVMIRRREPEVEPDV